MATADLQKYSTNPDGYTEYFIIVSFLGSRWAIKKRFRDFVALDTYLREVRRFDIPVLLPSRNWWQRFDPYVVEQRKKELNSYLAAVLLQVTPTEENAGLRTFLEVDRELNKPQVSYSASSSSASSAAVAAAVVAAEGSAREVSVTSTASGHSNSLVGKNNSSSSSQGGNGSASAPLSTASGSPAPVLLPYDAVQCHNQHHTSALSYKDRLRLLVDGFRAVILVMNPPMIRHPARRVQHSGPGSGSNSSMNNSSMQGRRGSPAPKFERVMSSSSSSSSSSSMSYGHPSSLGGNLFASSLLSASNSVGESSSSLPRGKQRSDSRDSNSFGTAHGSLALLSSLKRESPGPGTTSSGSSMSVSSSSGGIGAVFASFASGNSNKNGSSPRVLSSAEVQKQKLFINYVGKQLQIFNDHCVLILRNLERPTVHQTRGQLTAAGSTGGAGSTISKSNIANNICGSAVFKVLSAPLDMGEVSNLLDEVADNLIEASMQHLTLTLAVGSGVSLNSASGSDGLVVTELVEYKNYGENQSEGLTYKGRTLSGSKYSYFNKELKRLSLNEKKKSSGPRSRSSTPVGGSSPPTLDMSISSSVGGPSSSSSGRGSKTGFFRSSSAEESQAPTATISRTPSQEAAVGTNVNNAPGRTASGLVQGIPFDPSSQATGSPALDGTNAPLMTQQQQLYQRQHKGSLKAQNITRPLPTIASQTMLYGGYGDADDDDTEADGAMVRGRGNSAQHSYYMGSDDGYRSAQHSFRGNDDGDKGELRSGRQSYCMGSDDGDRVDVCSATEGSSRDEVTGP